MTDLSLMMPGDPMLDFIRPQAARYRQARVWLLDSAREWARLEFLRRARDEPVPFTEVWELHEKQVATWTREMKGYRTHVGLLLAEATEEYLAIHTAEIVVRGMFTVLDLFELPECYHITGWGSWVEPEPEPPERVIERDAVDEASSFVAANQWPERDEYGRVIVDEANSFPRK